MPHHARTRAALIAITLIVLPGCGRQADEPEAAAKAFVPPAAIPVKPLPGQTPLTSLDAYLGHDPHDPVEGVEFFDRTDVATALVAAVTNEHVRKEFREGTGPARPIFERGTQIAAWGCEGQDCAGRNWTFFLDRKSGEGEACLHDAATMGATSHWYAGGVKPVVRGGDCPSG